ncbi:survival motor neuron interacting protein 1-domain-containing protein [Pisolithus orientalis]|uniref:survival motor neuron interacting protein 1-domain-containing protein n=1 Tax=Pisolithus orientalis TaxID=936130 RepID=UPI002224FC36|nr:survival motor neuron interacting protein 1-domain-containing protein [Pisolithus orientalis]KAI6035093.1 survival motor neuron interacting protein 1-domain-containing protein [Pisolithus orientalis]
MVNKRKREEPEDSDLDEPAPGKQILPVANLPEDFNGDPADGMQYLFLVRRDARRLPRIKRAHNPYEESVRPPVLPLSALAKGVLPCEKWRDIFQSRFRNLRKNMMQPTVHVRHSSLIQSLIPEKKDREAWWKFLAGRPESEWSPAARAESRKKSKPSHNTSVVLERLRNAGQGIDTVPPSGQNPVETPGNDTQTIAVANLPSRVMTEPSDNNLATISMLQDQAQQEDAKLMPREATPSRLRGIDHRMSIHLLMYFAHWINLHLQNFDDASTIITNSHARWMLSLLTKVEDTVSADEMSLLRNLARACLGILQTRRDLKNADRVEAAEAISDASCWMVFTAVASVWGQKDLWTDAEDVLSLS